jgi:predicted HD phosphohydrolase
MMGGERVELMLLVERIEALFERRGRTLCHGEDAEPVSALEHALQCAHLAERARADATLVAAALLHDIGHFIDAPRVEDGVDDAHELRAIPFLCVGFGNEVLEPIRLHVQAKRYLVATNARYAAKLSPSSRCALSAQGGAMSREEQQWFEDRPFAQQALLLRRWDDAAKEVGRLVPPLAHYSALLRKLAGAAPAPRDAFNDPSAR